MPPLPHPLAHALRQAREKLAPLLPGFPPAGLNAHPADLASVGFHLWHRTGVLDRLATYARAEPLTAPQLAYLAAETTPLPATAAALDAAFAHPGRSFRPAAPPHRPGHADDGAGHPLLRATAGNGPTRGPATGGSGPVRGVVPGFS